LIDEPELRSSLKRLIVETLNLEGVEPQSIADEQPLFGTGLGLDSVDALELMVAIEKQFGIRIETGELDRSAFASVAALASMVSSHVGQTKTLGGQ
jgi:acyl carrier protein